MARSRAMHPQIAPHRDLIHKIGGRVGKRLGRAHTGATYRLIGMNHKKLGKLLHRVLTVARLDIALTDRFGQPVHPREWFLVPLPAIQEAVQRIQDGTITAYGYDPQQGRLVQEQP